MSDLETSTLNGNSDPLLNALNRLEKVGDKEVSHVKISKSEGKYQVLNSHDGESSSILHKLLNFFRSFFMQPSHLDDLKLTKDLFEDLRSKIVDGNVEKPQRDKYRAATEKAFKGLKQLYEKYRDDTSIEGMIIRDDILDALSVAYRGKDSLNELLNLEVSRVSATPIRQVGEQFRQHHIPLFRREDLDDISKLLKDKYPHKAPTLEEIRQDPDLGKYLIKEKTYLGFLMESMYEHSKIGRILNNRFINWGITKFQGFIQKKHIKESPKRTQILLNFFKKMNISPSMEYKGKIYSYREIHGRSLREEKNVDEAFQRPISKFAQEILTEEARIEKERVQSEIGPQGSIVTSNSFCRLRVLNIPKYGSALKFPITSKVLSESDENLESAKKKRGYSGKFMFSVKNLLGNEDKVDTSIDSAVKAEDLTLNEAEYLYRTCLTHAVDRNDATMVVQRLAPADIHHYTEPVGGRVLNIKEATMELQNMLQEAPEAERAQLEELIKKFESQDEKYQKKGVAKVKGTRTSVSTLAVKYQSPLTQNDRKIMMVKHDDGSIAIHTFIGAVGVNNVKVNAGSEEYKIGEDRGSMGFGDDEVGRNQWMGTATQRDSIKLKQKAGEKVRLGETEGKFHQSGSTIVSIYFKKYFRILDKIEKATRTYGIIYKDTKADMEREIEIKSKIGDIIGYPVDYHAMQVVKKQCDAIGVDRDILIVQQLHEGKEPEQIAENLLAEITEDNVPENLGSTDRSIRKQLLRGMSGFGNIEDQYLYDRLVTNLNRYIEVKDLARKAQALIEQGKKPEKAIMDEIDSKPENEKEWWEKEIKKSLSLSKKISKFLTSLLFS